MLTKAASSAKDLIRLQMVEAPQNSRHSWFYRQHAVGWEGRSSVQEQSFADARAEAVAASLRLLAGVENA